MRILVTGAAGQVGTDLISLLAEKGHQPAGFDLAKAGAIPSAGVEWVQGDITEEAEVFDAVKALSPSGLPPRGDPLGDRREGALPRLAREHGRHEQRARGGAAPRRRQVVFASTIAAFRPGPANPVGNDVSMRPTTMYGLTKVAGSCSASTTAPGGASTSAGCASPA